MTKKNSQPDPEISARLTPFLDQLIEAGAPRVVRDNFAYYFGLLAAGHTGIITEEEIEPVPQLPDTEDFDEDLQRLGQDLYARVVQIKLNGGLGTSMGLEQAKSLLLVKEGLSFLDILARQSTHSRVPLILMNSERTRAESLETLAKYPDLPRDLPLDFPQNMIPKIAQENLEPARWSQDPALEWNPPGHGDFYSAISSSGLLEVLVKQGYEFAFVSNADNLGAVLDPGILGYMAQNSHSFLMEVADRTEADRKGGHLARRKSGSLVLRESAQTREADQESFQDIARHKYFNTNNIWIHLPTLYSLHEKKGGLLELPLIRNSKTVDPRDPASPPIFQIETAIGAAIEVFEGAGAVRVPRSRFAPVKTTNDLLAVRSNLFTLTDEYLVLPNPVRQIGPILIDLDPDYYRLIDAFESRFPYGPPDLLACETLKVRGDIMFSQGLTLKGTVVLENSTSGQAVLKSEAPLQGRINLDPGGI